MRLRRGLAVGRAVDAKQFIKCLRWWRGGCLGCIHLGRGCGFISRPRREEIGVGGSEVGLLDRLLAFAALGSLVHATDPVLAKSTHLILHGAKLGEFDVNGLTAGSRLIQRLGELVHLCLQLSNQSQFGDRGQALLLLIGAATTSTFLLRTILAVGEWVLTLLGVTQGDRQRHERVGGQVEMADGACVCTCRLQRRDAVRKSLVDAGVRSLECFGGGHQLGRLGAVLECLQRALQSRGLLALRGCTAAIQALTSLWNGLDGRVTHRPHLCGELLIGLGEIGALSLLRLRCLLLLEILHLLQRVAEQVGAATGGLLRLDGSDGFATKRTHGRLESLRGPVDHLRDGSRGVSSLLRLL